MIIKGIILGLLLSIMYCLEVFAKLKNLKWVEKDKVFWLNLAIYVAMTLLLMISDYVDLKKTSAAIVLAFLLKEICVQIIDHILQKKIKTDN